MERIAAENDEDYFQGDEKGAPIDFFLLLFPAPVNLTTPLSAYANWKSFRLHAEIIEPTMRWYDDVDGNFSVNNFRRRRFDSRIWELYPVAAFTEMGFDISRIHAVPDFRCSNPFKQGFDVEATTVNLPKIKTAIDLNLLPRAPIEELNAYLDQYMPVKFGSALTSKLVKRYWEKPAATGLPLVFAIQDFSSPQSMLRTRGSFEKYITGYAHIGTHDAEQP